MGTLRPEEESVGELLQRLVEDGKGYVHAEIGYYRTLVEAKLGAARSGLVLAAIALVLLFAAAIALVVGLVLTLATLVGPGFATLIVVVGMAAIAALLGWIAWARLKRAFGGEA